MERLFCRYWFYKTGYRNCITTKIHEGIATRSSENNVSAWKEYMKWTLLNGSTGLLSSTVDAANFDFGKTLTVNQTR
jgi:predicted metalloendopeptidase